MMGLAALLLLCLTQLAAAPAPLPVPLQCAGCRRLAQQAAPPNCTPLLNTGVPQPTTRKEPTQLTSNFADAAPRIDNYAWLRDDFRNSTLVLSHLQEENAYAEAVLAPARPLQDWLLQEMLGRLPGREASVPQRRAKHWYYSVHEKGMQYRRYCRRPIASPEALPTEHDAMDLGQPEEVLLDEDALAGQQRGRPFLTPPLPAWLTSGGRSYFDLAGPEFSQDEQLMAYGIDSEGSEVYTLYVRNLTSNATLVDGGQAEFAGVFRECAGHFVFLDDNRTILFTTQTKDTHRPDKVWRFDLARAAAGGQPDGGDEPAWQAQLVQHQPDERFHLALWRSESLVFLGGGSETSQYLLYLPAGADLAGGINFTSLAPPAAERQYVVRHHPGPPSSSSSSSSDGGADSGSSSEGSSSSSEGSREGSGFVYAVVYSAKQRNGELVVTALGPNALAAAEAGGPAPANATDAAPAGNATAGPPPSSGEAGSALRTVLQPHSWDVEIVDIAVSAGHLAVLERRNGTLAATAYALPKDGSPLPELPQGQHFGFDAPSYSLRFGEQGPFRSPLLRVVYSSLSQPSTVYDIHMGTGNRVLKQQQEVVGFDMQRYLARLLWAPSSGGAAVPVSVAYRGDAVRLDGSDPLLLEAYGAYGDSFDPEFSGARLSLLDRGFVYAIAHVRGGGELGRYWYQDGKLLAKNHTFDDVAAAAELLIKAKYSSAERMALWGRSAGGLTVGATINRRPELFQAAILDVPFVDVVQTMSDPALPLTVIEYEEWGNPSADEAAYRNMLSYSPLDNVAPQPYPHLLLTGGLHDPRVSYWEPAKFAAKVRELQTSSERLVLLKTNMAAGHFADSGLEGKLREMALKFAFLIQTVAPCAGLSAEQRQEAEGGGCRGCFAVFVAVVTTVALVVLAVMLNPTSPFGRKWRRLRSTRAGEGGRGPGGGRRGPGSDGEDEEEGAGFDTRLYSAHMSDSQLEEATERQRQLRQQHLAQEGLSLAPYDAVRDTVRDRLLPSGARPSAAAPDATPPKRRLSLSPVASPACSPSPAGGGGGIELAAVGGVRGDLSPIAESPNSSRLSL